MTSRWIVVGRAEDSSCDSVWMTDTNGDDVEEAGLKRM